jgi:hypothetical protein
VRVVYVCVRVCEARCAALAVLPYGDGNPAADRHSRHTGHPRGMERTEENYR